MIAAFPGRVPAARNKHAAFAATAPALAAFLFEVAMPHIEIDLSVLRRDLAAWKLENPVLEARGAPCLPPKRNPANQQRAPVHVPQNVPNGWGSKVRRRVVAFLAWLLEVLDPKVAGLDFIFFDGITTHKVKHMQTTINDSTAALLRIICTSVAGNAVMPAVSVSDPTLATIVLADDGKSVAVTPTGKLGTFTLTATAGNLVATDDFTVIAGPATVLQLVDPTQTSAEPITSGT